ncbi:MAG: hypothetical protein WKG07_24495 [Hymenobacter sp.]
MNEVTKTTKEVSKKAKVESYDISRSDETLDLAKDLAKFIKDNKLTTERAGQGVRERGRLAVRRLAPGHRAHRGARHQREQRDQELKYQAKVTLYRSSATRRDGGRRLRRVLEQGERQEILPGICHHEHGPDPRHRQGLPQHAWPGLSAPPATSPRPPRKWTTTPTHPAAAAVPAVPRPRRLCPAMQVLPAEAAGSGR